VDADDEQLAAGRATTTATTTTRTTTTKTNYCDKDDHELTRGWAGLEWAGISAALKALRWLGWDTMVTDDERMNTKNKQQQEQTMTKEVCEPHRIHTQ
jgi:hypothetical protein